MRRRKDRAKIAARRLPAHMQDVAFSKFSPKAERARKLAGTYGPASPVRRIDPETGSVIEDDRPLPCIERMTP